MPPAALVPQLQLHAAAALHERLPIDATPPRLPASISVRLIHSLSVCAVQPIFAATDVIAAQCKVCSYSRTRRTARLRT